MRQATTVKRDSPRTSRAKTCSGIVLIVSAIHLTTACADEAKTAKETPTQASASALRESSLPLYKLGKSPKAEWKLSNRLKEISGLATTADGRILAHNDERAIIYEIDVDDGIIVKSFHLGLEGIEADFEGIAVAEDSIFLVTSKGTIYETVEGAADEEVQYTTYDSGIGDICEVEGLEYEPSDRTLLLACKTTRGSRLKDGVAVFRWSIESRGLSDPRMIWISEDDIRQHLPQKQFHPSGIARHPASGTYLIISAREHALLEIEPSGKVVSAKELKRGRHPHAEGIAVGVRKTGAFDLVISNEGDKKRARLAIYRDRSRKKDD